MIGKLASLATIALATALALPAMAQDGEPARLRGTIDALNGNVLSITTREGPKIDITLDEGHAVNYAVPKTLADIKDNDFIGAAAIERDGKLVALEVLVFPEAARGFGEGHYAWDLTPESNMTNATVSEVGPEGDGVTVTVKYPDGEKTINVPADIPVWTFETGSDADLKEGMYVFVAATKHADGSYSSGLVIVEKDGFKPPN